MAAARRPAPHLTQCVRSHLQARSMSRASDAQTWQVCAWRSLSPAAAARRRATQRARERSQGSLTLWDLSKWDARRQQRRAARHHIAERVRCHLRMSMRNCWGCLLVPPSSNPIPATAGAAALHPALRDPACALPLANTENPRFPFPSEWFYLTQTRCVPEAAVRRLAPLRRVHAAICRGQRHINCEPNLR